MAWDTDKLDALAVEIQESVITDLREEEQRGVSEDISIARVVGYWMCRLLECNPGIQRLGVTASIDGPLFDGSANAVKSQATGSAEESAKT